MNGGAPEPNFRILIIDDNPTIHGDFRKILCPDNAPSAAVMEMEAALFDRSEAVSPTVSFQVDAAYQGKEGLEMVRRSLAENRPYALAFVDVRMPPGWDGVETIAHIWKEYPELQVVLCTAYTDYSWKALREKVGQPDSLLVLKKPFDNVEVQQLAQALTKKWLLTRTAAFKIAELEALLRSKTSELAQATAALAAAEERLSKVLQAGGAI